MNTDWMSLGAQSYYGTDSQWHTSLVPASLSDLEVVYYDQDVDAGASLTTLTAGDGLVLETMPSGIKTAFSFDPGTPYGRIRGIPFSVSRKLVLVLYADSMFSVPAANKPQVWQGSMGDPQIDENLYTLFAATPGLTPVIFQFTDAGTGDPIGNVEITVWDSTLSVPVVPLLRTTSGGLAKCGLPAGAYKVFAFLPYASFTDLFPVDLTVGPTTTTLAMTLTQSTPALPVVPKVTVFGWVLRPDFVPVSGSSTPLRCRPGVVG